MRQYIFKRLIFSIPTLFLITIIVFGLSKAMPGDAAERLTGAIEIEFEGEDYSRHLSRYERTYRQLGLDLPHFYLSVQPAAVDPNLRNLPDAQLRKSLKGLMYETGSPELVMEYQQTASAFFDYLRSLKGAECMPPTPLNQLERGYRQSLSVEQLQEMRGILSSEEVAGSCREHDTFIHFNSSLHQLIQQERSNFWWVPKLYWNGTDNQYHRWISQVVRGNWGYSLRDGRPIGNKIYSALSYTLYLSAMGITLTFLLGIPLGLFLAVSKREKIKSLFRTIIYGLYAMPLFWMATLLLIFFTTEEYGKWTNIFPSPTSIMMQSRDGLSVFSSFFYLFLPIVCLALNGMAFVARQMEQSALREKYKAYIAMSKAKGNSNRTTLWAHLFPNATFPLITLLGAILPSLISGSVVIEVIFNIPGMGRLLWDSIFGQDWNTVYAILLLGGVLTVLGQLLADILYAKTDPRVRYD